MADECDESDGTSSGIRHVVKVSATSVAAAVAIYGIYSGYVPVPGVSAGQEVTLNTDTVAVLLVQGIILALPLARLMKSDGTLQEAVELSAIVAIISAMVFNPDNSKLSTDTFAESAVRALHVFTVVLVAALVNTSI